MVGRDDFPPLLGLPIVGAFEMPFSSHLTLAAMLAILVERLVSQ